MIKKVDPEKFKEIIAMFKDLDYYQQGKMAYKLDVTCPYAKDSAEADEWKRGEIEASLEDE